MSFQGTLVPLTKTGAKVKAAMAREYGADKGERVFYASMNKGNPGSSKWHRKKTGKSAPIQRDLRRR